MSLSPVADPLRIWVLTDGKAGDEIPCVGVAEELLGVRELRLEERDPRSMDPRARYAASFQKRIFATGSIDIRRVSPRRPWVWLMPRGPIDPAEGPLRSGSPIAPPWPDLLIASGRRAVPYVRAVKRLSGGATFAVILKDPRIARHGADLVWVPEHDLAPETDFLRTLTTPHRFSAGRLAATRLDLKSCIAALPHPRVAILLGGRTRYGPFSREDREALCRRLSLMAGEVGSFLVTVSRRTPPDLIAAVKAATETRPRFIWDQTGPNPYLDILAAADALVVTGDSHSMISEASATGAPVLIFPPACVKPKLTYFAMRMFEEGWARPFRGSLDRASPTAHDSTPMVAAEIRQRMADRATTVHNDGHAAKPG